MVKNKAGRKKMAAHEKPTPGEGVGLIRKRDWLQPRTSDPKSQITNLKSQILRHKFHIPHPTSHIKNHDLLRSSAFTGYPCSASFGAYFATSFSNFPMHFLQQK